MNRVILSFLAAGLAVGAALAETINFSFGSQ